MTQKTTSLGPVAVTLSAGLLVVVAALAVPMRRGASLWEAIAVLPQPVLWVVPLAFAVPPLLALVARVRPRPRRRPDPDRDALPTGSLASLAELLRRAIDGRWARSRVAARLTRVAVHVACVRYSADEDEAWEMFRAETARRAPEVERFLRRDGLFSLSGDAFSELVDRTLTYLETFEQEA